MVVVVQLVRTPDCGSGGRRFESGLPPFFSIIGRHLMRGHLLYLLCEKVNIPIINPFDLIWAVNRSRRRVTRTQT